MGESIKYCRSDYLTDLVALSWKTPPTDMSIIIYGRYVVFIFARAMRDTHLLGFFLVVVHCGKPGYLPDDASCAIQYLLAYRKHHGWSMEAMNNLFIPPSQLLPAAFPFAQIYSPSSSTNRHQDLGE